MTHTRPDFGQYVLDGHEPVPVADSDFVAWARWMEDHDRERQVAETWFGMPKADDAVLVSTVFVGIDRSLGRAPKPVLFETMVFWADHEMGGMSRRYATWDEALAGHMDILEQVRAAYEDGGLR